MKFLLTRWQGIGTKLYLALAFAVILTLISSGVGIYYFERSGDLNYQAEQQAVPVLEAAWEAAGETKELRLLGIAAATTAETAEEHAGKVSQSLRRLNQALSQASAAPQLVDTAGEANVQAVNLASTIDQVRQTRDQHQAAQQQVAQLLEIARTAEPEEEASRDGLLLLQGTLTAGGRPQVEADLAEFRAMIDTGMEQEVLDLAGGESGVFSAKRLELALGGRTQDLTRQLTDQSSSLESTTDALLELARQHSSETLGQSVQSFDQGRVLLAAISIVSVIAAVIAAWFWVGNAVIRRLSRLSERMRAMVTGDLETPVPEIGGDEIGQLANALEHFRRSLEVQRLNLVEKSTGNSRRQAELQRMQARLVAQEKLAALGELVSGVAHEISNPLNFVKNFSEGSLDLYQELAEMMENYRDRMSDEDASLLDELNGDITQSLNRVSFNGGRALGIVERMRSLSTAGGVPVLTDLNAALRRSAQQGYELFLKEAEEFNADIEYTLEGEPPMTMMVEREFADAVVNLVTNSCYAMKIKQAELGDGYTPLLQVSSRLGDDGIEVHIRDNGTGIEDEIKGRIFNPFFTTQEGAMGAGLGLTIAADVARRMGGDLTFESEPGEYAEFTLQIPVENGETGNADPEEPAEAGQEEPVPAGIPSETGPEGHPPTPVTFRLPQTDAGRNTAALAMIIAAALIWSVIPVAMTATGLHATILYVALYRGGGAAGSILSMAIAHPALTREYLNPARVAAQGFRKRTAATAAVVSLAKLDWLLYLYALRNLPSHIAVLTFYLWPVAMILGLQASNRGTGRYSRSGRLTVPALTTCLAGTAMVVLPGTTGQGGGNTAAVAVAAAFVAAIMAGVHTSGAVVWGDAAGDRLTPGGTQAEVARRRAFFSIWMQAAGQIGSMAITAGAAIATGTTLGPLETATAFTLGFATAGIGDAFFRTGTAVAAHPAMPMACYTEPVFSLIWLQLAYGLQVSNPALTATGIVLIIGANAVITNGGHFRPRKADG